MYVHKHSLLHTAVYSSLTLTQPQYHDTFGAAIPNLLTSLSLGLRTFDSSIAGLGGCPYSPGATGNVATEDVLHVLMAPESGYVVEGHEQGLDLRSLVETGEWVSQVLGRRNESKAGRAYAAKWRREKEEKQKSRL
jgi:hydroxymethylglutaryl-CoA lyase